MKITLLNRITEKAASAVPEMNSREFRQLLYINLAVLFFSFFWMGYHLLAGYSGDYFITDVLFLFVFLLSSLSLVNGMVSFSLNTLFFLPVVVFVAYISDFVPHAPEKETISIPLLAFIAATAYLIIYSSSLLRIAGFYMVSLIILIIHAAQADLLDTYLSASQDFIHNPLLVYTLLAGLMLLIRSVYKYQLVETSHDLKKIQANVTELFSGIRYPAIHLGLERDKAGLVTSMNIRRVNSTFESVFKVRFRDLKNLNAGIVFQRITRGAISPENILFDDFENKKEYYLDYLKKWFAIYVLKSGNNDYYVIFNDVTDERQIISGLIESKQRYRVLLEAIPDIFFIIGRDGTYEDFVIKADDKLKIDDSEIIGKTIYEVGFSQMTSDKIFECIQSAIENNTIEVIEYGLTTDHGSFVFEMRIARLNENSVISIARDISRRKLAEFRLIEAKEKVEEVLRLKSVFLASLSHNIRTPMNIILGFSKMLCDNNHTGLDRDFLIKGISQNSHLLLKMIDDTINLSKIETNSVELNTGQVKINRLFRDLYSHFSALLPDRQNIKLEFSQEIKNPEFGFITDYDLLFESMKKLIDNAIKFSQKGTVRFGYSVRFGKEIEFFVEDEGIGISKEEQKYIFDRFYVGKSHQAESAGSGLGLPIARHFVTLLGGDLKVDSKQGLGSRFYFNLPIREGEGFLRIVS